MGILYLFSRILTHMNLAKMRIPRVRIQRTCPSSISICLATIGVRVFRCADLGWRAFLILNQPAEMGEKMEKHSQRENRNAKNQNEKDFLANTSEENRELFKRAISEGLELEIRKIEEESKDIKIPSQAKRKNV